MAEPVRVRCPATAANLGPGMDALGLALELWNTFTVAEAEEGFTLVARGRGAGRLSRDATGSPLVQAYQATREVLGRPPVKGLLIDVDCGVPPCSGLGSSATSIVAGVLAAEAASVGELDERARVEIASRVEGHPDNVLPCLIGGLCTVAADADGRLDWLRAVPADPPRIVVLLADSLELSTQTMRDALPAQVSLQDAIKSVGAASMLVFALLQGERRTLPLALDDWLQQPYRSPHIPGWADVRQAALDAGALGMVTSGSGPTLLALLADDADPAAVGLAMQKAWAAVGVEGTAQEVAIAARGARVEEGP